MGCDIHIWAEIQQINKKTDEKFWMMVGSIFKNPYYRPEGVPNTWNEPLTKHPYSGRNYDLFAMLADVRNGRGFAGCITGEGFTPIDDPRGVPEDASYDYKDEVERYGVDGHSHSWFTLQELLDYDWEGQTSVLYGVVDRKNYDTSLS